MFMAESDPERIETLIVVDISPSPYSPEERSGQVLTHKEIIEGMLKTDLSTLIWIVEAAKKVTSLPLDVHLMIDEPYRYIDDFIAAGSHILSVHVEAGPHLHRTIHAIKERGAKAGVALNPSTPLSAIECILEDADMIVVMSVNPGSGGQQFIESALKKIEILRNIVDEKGMDIEIEVDGGVNVHTIEKVALAGANVFVAGSGIFGTSDYKETIRLMRERIRGAISG